MATITDSRVLTERRAISLPVLKLKGIGSVQTPSSKFYGPDRRLACVTEFNISQIKPSNRRKIEAGSKNIITKVIYPSKTSKFVPTILILSKFYLFTN